jgi:hypothetical protein
MTQSGQTSNTDVLRFPSWNADEQPVSSPVAVASTNPELYLEWNQTVDGVEHQEIRAPRRVTE